MFKSCNCLSPPLTDPMKAPIPQQVSSNAERNGTRTGTLARKPSKLQMSVEVFKCRVGKSSAAMEGGAAFAPSKEWTPLYHAVYNQRGAALTYFLRSGDSPDDVTGTGQPPLCIAVIGGNIEIVRILLEAGADVNAITKDSGETALHIAVKNSRNDLVDLILQNAPNLEAQTEKTGETPLHYAASKSGSLATVVSLLKLGAKYDSLNASFQTPAEAALQTNNLNSAVAIINAAHGKSNKFTKEKEMLLKHVQKTKGRFSIGNELIADIFTAACDPDLTVLVEAIKRDDASLVEMFLERGADPDRETIKGLRPLFVALEGAGAPVVQALVKHKADLSVRNDRGLTVLQAVFESPLAQDKETVSAIFDCMLDNGADASATYSDGQTLLHRAVSPRFGLTRVANLLINAGNRVDVQDKDGNTPLHFAIHSRACVEMLLENSASPRQLNYDNISPLMYAAMNRNREQEPDLDLLVKSSDLRATNSDNQTVLHLAAANGLEKLVRLLLRARMDTSLVDANNLTPLLLAVKNQQWTVVRILAVPPSINSWDEDGMSALHHIAKSTPVAPWTWKDIAAATAPFCERGVSRSMRDQSGATPLILAIKTLPEEGLPVVQTLLAQKADKRASFNCVSHEDHQQCNALFYAMKRRKIVFVEALLKSGAMFTFEDWTRSKKKPESSVETDKQIMELLAQYEWARRAGSLRRQSSGPNAGSPTFSAVFPVKQLKEMIQMGLDPSALPRSPFGGSLLWAILYHIPLQPPLDPKYIYETIKLVLDAGADPNLGTARSQRHSPSPMPPPPRAFLEPNADNNACNSRSSRRSASSVASSQYRSLEAGSTPNVRTSRSARCSPSLLPRSAPNSLPPSANQSPMASRESLVMSMHPLTFLLEELPTVDIELVTLFTTKGAKLSVASPFYGGCFPLHSAVKANRIDVVDEFLLQRADVHCKDHFGRTPLFLAAEKGLWEIVDALIRRGARVNIEDSIKNTPLHAAAAGGSKRVVAALLRAGARANVRNKKGETPLDRVADDMDEKEKDKILPMLNDSQERERHEEKRDCRQKERDGEPEARMKARKEEDLKAHQHREEDQRERIRKEQEFNAKLKRQREEMEENAAREAVSKKAATPPRSKSTKIFFFRKSSLLSARPSIAVPAVPTMPNKQPLITTMRVTTPPSKLSQLMTSSGFPSSKEAPQTPKTAPSATAAILVEHSATTDIYGITSAPAANTTKPTLQKGPRIDSGFGQQRHGDADKPLPSLNRNEPTLSGKGELSDWIALSKMLDNL